MSEKINFKLDAYMPSGADIQVEGVTLKANGQEVYLDLTNAENMRSERNGQYGTHTAEFEGVPVLDQQYGELADIGRDDLRGAEVAAVHVRCEREENLYFEPTGARVTMEDSETGHQVDSEQLGLSEGLEVQAADPGGNDWHVSGHKPRLDEIIADAQARSQQSAQSQDRSKSKDKEM